MCAMLTDMRRRLMLMGTMAALPAWGAPQGVRPRPLRFPADFGAHPDTRIEWWYATGWLHAAEPAAPDNGGATPAFGFQITFFRSRTEVDAGHPSRFAATQLVFAHAALTDLGARRLRHDQRIARSGFGLAFADGGDTRVALRDWRLSRSGAPEASVYSTRAASDSAGFAFELRLAASQPLLLQGVDGYSRKGPRPAQASHYYSQPQLGVTGTLQLDGRPLAVRGRAWLDHEWSDTLLDAQAVGWDWIGMNLHDGSALTAFRLRRADGSSLYAGGSFRAAGGAARNFGPDEVRMQAGRRWASPGTQVVYPVEWRVATPAGEFNVRALLDSQELDSRASTGTVYWEALSELRDDQGRLVGHGYLEMTGYAAPITL